MTIAGGKLTGYRQMAETIVDKIVKSRRYKHASACLTRELALSGAKGINAINFLTILPIKLVKAYNMA